MTKILVIEDEAAVRSNILELLTNEGFEVMGAENGTQGLILAQEQIPNLILCDIMMPGLDGYQVLEALRDDPMTALIPLIFLTAKASSADLRYGMEKGADDYITKPFSCKELLRAISVRLAKQETVNQLQHKIADLQRLNLLKDDLINTVSHDLRAPLANMKLAIQMLAVAKTSEQQQRYLKILQAECGREINLVNNLLDLQRLESQTYQVSLQAVELAEWLSKVIEPFRVRTSERHQNFQADWDAHLPAIVSDPESLERVIAELLNNACKYTPPGEEIDFKVRCTRKSRQQPSLVSFAIKNRAEIPSTALPHLFEKFYRVPGSDLSKQGGTGLGLALVQKLVERLGGNIQVDSQCGWTTFTVNLPASCPVKCERTTPA